MKWNYPDLVDQTTGEHTTTLTYTYIHVALKAHICLNTYWKYYNDVVWSKTENI